MGYKTLSSYPQEYMDTWNMFLQNPDFQFLFSTKAAATSLRHRLYSFRSQLRKEAKPVADVYEHLELSIEPQSDGQWAILARRAAWKLQLDAAKKVNGDSDDSTT